MTQERPKAYVALLSVHGLIRGSHLELGRDADTGGQVRYVLELARALAARPEVARVDLLTRQVIDAKVDPDYGEPIEPIAPNAFIVRLPCGPRRYLRKESLWPHLYSFTDAALQHFRRVGRTPDWLHSHYADAGWVGARLASLLEVPLIHTGHSLGRVKQQRLLEQGMNPAAAEAQYNLSQRIEAEEITLDHAALVVASTRQEVDDQYGLYGNFHPKRMVVIPPGVNLERFYPPGKDFRTPPIAEQIHRFLRHPKRPMVLALARPDPKKNFETLIRAFGEHPDLRNQANLVLIAGNRDEIETMDRGGREVMGKILHLIDRYDLYGHVAYPKHHAITDVPELYRLAAKSGGLFVNPALNEPFGLTLIEAAASGLPVIATEDGGPRDILAACKNGLLVDPLDADRMGEAIASGLSDRVRWRKWSKSGATQAEKRFTWQAHVERYLKKVQPLRPKRLRPDSALVRGAYRLTSVDRVLICDIDNTLLGDRQSLDRLMEQLHAHPRTAFGIATGRRLDSAVKVLKQWGVPMPDVLITAVGSEIHYGPNLQEDGNWCRHINYRWKPDALHEAMRKIPGVRLQAKSEQREHKISYLIDPSRAPSVRGIVQQLRRLDLHARVIASHDRYLDLLPVRASKGLAVRYFAGRWGIPPERILVAGDSGNDEEMLRGNTLGVVVGNYSAELEKLRDIPHLLFARGHYAEGILEAIEHYYFFDLPAIPENEGGPP